MDEQGICGYCEGALSLEEVRRGTCPACLNDVIPWAIGFMGDIHKYTERKTFSWKEE